MASEQRKKPRRGAPRLRGVVEGFYGAPYTFDQREDLLRFLPQAGLNTYLYAPKLDPFHRERWREPYPPEFVDHFGRLAGAARQQGTRFVYSLSPGLSFDPAGGDTDRVRDKLATLFAAGVRDFCLLFDDIEAGRAGADPDVQADLVIDCLNFLRQRDSATTLCFISNLYAGTAKQLRAGTSPFQFMFPIPSSVYYAAYKRIPEDVGILWTGPAVFTDRLTVDEAQRFRDFVRRPVLLWDNYPVNDAMREELFLAPYEGREHGLGNALDGILLNPMLQPEASKIALWTAGRFFADGDSYDPHRALDEALEIVGQTKGTAPLRVLAEHFQGHPLIGDGCESSRLAAQVDDFFAARSNEALLALRQTLQACACNAHDLGETLTNQALASELREPARKLSLLGEAGLLALDLLTEKGEGRPVQTDRLDELLAAANAIPWRPGANTPISADVARMIGERPATETDVFGRLLDNLRRELASD